MKHIKEEITNKFTYFIVTTIFVWLIVAIVQPELLNNFLHFFAIVGLIWLMVLNFRF